METTELRKKVITYVNEADEDTLRIIKAVLEKCQDLNEKKLPKIVERLISQAMEEKNQGIVRPQDKETLREVNEILENYIAKKIVAYSSDGQALSKEAYIGSIKAADATMDNGEFTSVEDLEKEVRNW